MLPSPRPRRLLATAGLVGCWIWDGPADERSSSRSARDGLPYGDRAVPLRRRQLSELLELVSELVHQASGDLTSPPLTLLTLPEPGVSLLVEAVVPAVSGGIHDFL
jgi:hypothetical protein